MKKLIFISVVLFFSFACTDAQKAKRKGYGSEYKIEMINCDGSVNRSWISTGKVRSEQHSDGYYFLDKNTGVLTEVSGRLIITQLQ